MKTKKCKKIAPSAFVYSRLQSAIKSPLLRCQLTDTVETGPLVVQRLSRFAFALFSRTESTEVLDRLGNIVPKETHDNATTVRGSFNFL